nr:MAG TPA_asm: hypothetical protein [Caudoviricetes sp.]
MILSTFAISICPPPTLKVLRSYKVHLYNIFYIRKSQP